MTVHELDIAHEVSDRIVCLGQDGTIKAHGTPKEVFSEESISALYGLKVVRLSEMYGGFMEAIHG